VSTARRLALSALSSPEKSEGADSFKTVLLQATKTDEPTSLEAPKAARPLNRKIANGDRRKLTGKN
jgi:hypothetical protein